jgi:hypothetical protein
MKIVCYSIAGLLSLYASHSLAEANKADKKNKDDVVQLEAMDVVAVTPLQTTGGDRSIIYPRLFKLLARNN